MDQNSSNLMSHSKDVHIQSIDLETEAFGTVPLINIFKEIQMFESIFESTMTLELSVTDSRNLPELANLRGGEKLTIRYKTAGYLNPVELNFHLDTISERTVTKEKNAIYVMSFVTKELVYDHFNKISRAFNNNNTDNYIKDILQNDEYGCNSEKELDFEQSIFVQKMVIPFWSPLQTIRWMKNRCVSALYPGSPFMFFENKLGFTLSSMEKLFAKEPIKTLSHSPRLNEENRDVTEDFNKVENYSVKETVKFLERLRGGAEASRLVTFDLVSKRLSNFEYSFVGNNTRNITREQQDEIDKPLVFDDNNIKEKYDSARAFSFKSTELDDANSFVEAWAKARESFLTNLNTICVECNMAGDSELNVGDTVNFSVASFAASGGTFEEDKILSGKYLVTSIAHFIEHDKYEMKIEICKDTFFRELQGTNTGE